MIYTIAITETFDKLFEEGPPPVKQGKFVRADGSTYGGANVFKTEEAAREYIEDFNFQDRYSVYGLDADWNTQTTQTGKKSCNQLLVDAAMIKLDAAVEK